jgi:hypothetical protein
LIDVYQRKRAGKLMPLGYIEKYKKILAEAIERNDQGLERINRRLDELPALMRANQSLANEISATNTEAFGEYRGCHKGRTVVVAGSGPSLNWYRPIEGCIHIGVNSAFLHGGLELDYYFTQDHRFDDLGYIKHLEGLDCEVFFGLCAQIPLLGIEPSESLRLRLNAKRYFFDPSPSTDICLDICHHPLMDFYTVVFPALHFALYTNPERIILVGCDTSFDGHFDNSPIRDTVQELGFYLRYRLLGYRKVRDFVHKWYPGTSIVSLNPVNLYGMFDDEFTCDEARLIEGNPLNRHLVDHDFSNEAIDEFVVEYSRQKQPDSIKSS